jgi:uncharacterized membrane protein YdjX (TVP38/TMEM64 family)
MTQSIAPSTQTRPAWRRLLPLAIMATVIAVVWASDWHRLLTLDNLFAVRARFHGFLAEYTTLAALAYIGLYATVVTLSLPGALIMTLSGGLVFGWLLGGAAAVTGASIGATLLFLIARSAFGESLRRKAGPKIAGLVDGFQKDALAYMLFLRIVPAFPFFLVNIAAALLGVPLRTYIIGTVLGIIPATFAFASIGAGLDSVLAKAQATQAACAAVKGHAACPLEFTTGSLVTPQLLFALSLLSIVALIPVAHKKWSNRHG